MNLAKPESNRQIYSCRLQFKRCSCDIRLPQLSEYISSLYNPSILGGNDADVEDNRFSYFAAEPTEIFEFNSDDTGLEDKLNTLFGRYKLDKSQMSDLPVGIFAGGWMGYFSYDLNRFFEKIPNSCEDDIKMPLIRLSFYDRVIAYDRLEGVFYLIAVSLPDSEDLEEKLDWLDSVLQKAKELRVARPAKADMESVDFDSIKSNMAQDEYLNAIRRTKEYIYEGDVYQINYSQRYKSGFAGRPIDLYHWQNEYNPSPYSAYICGDDWSVVSASPELYLEVQGDVVKTCPIKGTKPRLIGEGAEIDRINQQNIRELLESEKEQAELNMIIDLERNDIARICRPGTRFVSSPRHVRAFPSVYHALATIEGRLRKDLFFYEVLAATFPGGSITGAPKIRSMEIIDELEPTCRGIYTGSIGYIGLDGSVCLNIVIRTVIIKSSMAYVQTGGGIVADSDPDAEWRETLTKARALLAGISAVQSTCNLEKV